MDIAALSMQTAQFNIQQQVSTAMLANNLEMMENIGEDFTKMIEQSVTPHLGNNIDVLLQA